MMNFIDAVGNMQAGKRLMRTGWLAYAVSILPGQAYIWSIPSRNDSAVVNAAIYVPSVQDIQANDWIVKE